MTPPAISAWEIVTWFLDKGPGIAVVAGASWALIKWLGRPLTAIKNDIEMVKKELQVNGGGSLKDAVKRVETEVTGLNVETKKQTQRLIKLEKGQITTRKLITPLIKRLPGK